MHIKVKNNQLEEIEGLRAEYPYVMHHAKLNDTRIPWHWHEEVEFVYVEKGAVEVLTAGNKYTFRRGEAFFINTNILCTMNDTGSGENSLDSHLFHQVFLSGHFKSIFETKYMEPVLNDKKIEIVEIRGENARQREILGKLRKVSRIQAEEDSEFQTRNLFSEIWLLLWQEIKNADRSESEAKLISLERIQTLMSFIQQNYSEKITLDEIALSASLSKRECLRCFQSCIGKTPFEYLLEYRIESAKKMLRTTDEPISGIAFQTGFTNSAYFSKVFKEKCGMTPGEYRKKQIS